MDKKDHHYVPQSYLKKFYNNGKFWVLDFEKLSNGYKDYLSQKVSAQVCHNKYFYDLDEDFKTRNPEYANLDRQYIENETFKRLENQYSKILYNAITEKLRLTYDQCNAFADFIIQMKIRNPYYRNNDLKKNGSRLIDLAKQQIKHDAYHNERFKNVPVGLKETLLEFVTNEKYNGENFERNLQLYSLIKREEDRKTSTFLKDAILKHPWIIVTCGILGATFLTTDNPGASVSKIKSGVFNTKFNEDFIYYFPLSPFNCLIIDGTRIDVDFFNDSTIKKIEKKIINAHSVININDILIQNMNKLVISNQPHMLKLIAENNKKFK